MHVGTWECKNGRELGKSGSIPQTPEARYQAKETCLGIAGGALKHMEHDFDKNPSQETLHEAYNLFALGLKAPETMAMLAEERQKKWDEWDEAEKGEKPESPDFVKLEAETIKKIVKATQLRQKETKGRTRSVMDVSWSPPKSFSIIHAMTDNTELKARMEQAMKESVDETMADMEKLAMRRVRSWEREPVPEGSPPGTLGAIKKDEYGNNIQNTHDVHTGNIVYSSFMHYDSRPVELSLNDEMRDSLEKQGVELRDHDGQTFIVERVMEYNKKTRREEMVEKEKPFVRDMQLHMHTPIANLTYDENFVDEKTGKKGQWFALQKSEMMRQLPYFQAVASQRLAAKLEKMGFPVERDGERWEIGWFSSGEGREVINRFSKPTANVMQYAADYNLTKEADRKEINLKIRKNKQEGVSDQETLKKIWRAQLGDYEMGRIDNELHNREINEMYQGKPDSKYYDFTKNLDHHKVTAKQCIQYAIGVDKMRNAVFKTQDILTKAIHYGVTKTPEEIREAFDELVKDKVIFLSKDPKHQGYFTTAEMLAEEKQLVDLARKLKAISGDTLADMYAKTSGGKIFEASKFGTKDYTAGQVDVIASVLNNTGRISYIEGDAGTGKTTVGLQLKRAIELTGHRMIATSVATKAKEILTDDGYGKYLLVDKNNQMVMENDGAGNVHPRMVNLTEAKEYYKQEYDGEKNIPREIQASLKRKLTEDPQTLTRVLMGYEKYKLQKKMLARKDNPPDRITLLEKEISAFENKMRGQVLFIDEAGQLGTEQGVQVMTMVEEMDMHLILVGDRKQHKSVTRGNLLQVLVEEAGLDAFRLGDILRQSDQLRIACEYFAKGAWDSGLRKLDAIGGVTQIVPDMPAEPTGEKASPKGSKSPRDLSELKQQCVDDIVKELEAGRDPTIVVTKHSTGQEIDAMLRERLIALKGTGARCAIDEDRKHTFELLVRNNDFDSPEQRMQRSQYREGMALQFVQNIPTERTNGGEYKPKRSKGAVPVAKGMIGRGTVAKVLSVNKNNTLTLECHDKNGKSLRIMDLPKTTEEASNFVVGSTKETDLCPGDRIMLTKNIMGGKGNLLKNGKSFNVKDIRDEGSEHVIVLDSGNGNEIILRPESNPTHANFNRQFYKTSYGAQGGTSSKGKCIVFHETSEGKEQSGNLYVDLTRAFGKGEIGRDGKNNDLGLYCDSLEAVIEEARRVSNKPNSAIAFTNLDNPEAKPNTKQYPSYLYEDDQEMGRLWEHLKYAPELLQAVIQKYEGENLEKLAYYVELEWIMNNQPVREAGKALRKDNHADNIIIAREMIAARREELKEQHMAMELAINNEQFKGPEDEHQRL